MGAQIYGRTTVADGDKWIAVKVNADGSLVVGSSSGGEAATDTLPALTDRSGTVTTGGTAQDVMAANEARQWGSFVNLASTAGWIAEGATAVANTAGSQSIAAGQTYIVEGRGRLSWLHATTGAKFTAKEG